MYKISDHNYNNYSVCGLLSKNWPFSQNSIYSIHYTEMKWAKMHVLHKNMHILIPLVYTKSKLYSMKPIHYRIHLFMESKKTLFHVHTAECL